MGQLEEGLTVLTEALAVVDKTGERSYEAELYRLKGNCTLQQLSGRQSSRSDSAPRSEAEGSGRMFSAKRLRSLAAPAGEVAGASSNDEFSASVATARQA